MSSATAVSVEPISSASQIVRSFLRRAAPSGARRAVRWKTSTRSPAVPRTRRQTRSSGRSSIRGRDQRQTAGEPSPKTGLISTAPSNGDVRTSPVSGSPQIAKCRVGAVSGLNFLLVLRSGSRR